jgi:hypothetical protein
MSDRADDEIDVADDPRRKWVGVHETFRRLTHSECSSLLLSPIRVNEPQETQKDILRKGV